MTVTTVVEILADRRCKTFIHPSHNVPGDTTAKERVIRSTDWNRLLNRSLGVYSHPP